MTEVDIIRPGSINDIIGPVGTLKRMLKNQEFFNERGYKITIFTNDSIERGPISETPESSPIRQAKVPSTNSFRRKVGSFLRKMAKKNIFTAKWFIEKDRKIVDNLVNYYISLNRTPDIIQFHSNLECYLYQINRKETKAKTVMFLHTDGYPFKMILQYYPCLNNTRYLKKLEDEFAWTVANTTQINFIAKIGQKNFLQLYPNKPKEKTAVIINGIDNLSDDQEKEFDVIRNEYSDSKFKYRLCCSGTINFRKGHRIIIEALHTLSKDVLPTIHVDFMGEGGERPILEELVKKYELEDNVTFYGMIPNSEIYKYLARNNIYILMSKNEGLPISIIEAMRAGLPVISTSVSGIPELVREGYNGLLINPEVKELKAVFMNMNKYNWTVMGENSSMRFQNEFTFERMKREFCDMYDSLYL